MRNVLDLLIFVVTRFIIALFVLFIVTFAVYLNYPQPYRERPEIIKTPSYTEWLFGSGTSQGIVRGDYGQSLTGRRPALDMFGDAAPATLELMSLAVPLALIIGSGFGILMAFLRRRKTDVFLCPFAVLGLAMPVFWLALMLLLIFAFQARTFPVGGRNPIGATSVLPLSERLNYLVLPLTSLTILWISTVALHIRRAMLAMLNATAGGTLQFLLSVLQILPVVIAGLLSSAVVVEVIFAWPGVGRLLLTSALARDYPVIAATVTIISVWMVATYLLVNLVYAVLIAIFRASPYTQAAMRQPTRQPAPTTAAMSEQPRRTINSLSTIATSLAVIIVVGVVLLQIILPAAANINPTQVDPSKALQPPGSGGHVLGTDNLGRDQLARVLAGGQTTLSISFLAALLTLVIGVIVGILSGLLDLIPVAGRLLNTPIEAVITVLGIIPNLILLIFIVTTAGRPPDQGSLVLIFGLVGWPFFASVVRARTLVLVSQLIGRGQSAGAAERGQDSSPSGGRPVWLNLILTIIYGLALSMAAFILMETALSFLGQGIQPPQVSWGSIFAQAVQYLAKGGYLVIIPGLVITLVVFCLYIIAMRIQDSLDFLPDA